MVFANQNDIRFVEVSENQRNSLRTTVVVRKLDDVQGLDFFLKKNKVCWTELNEPKIKCSEINPEHKVTQDIIVNTGLKRPEGLACDWVNDNIYWTDSYTKRIEVVSMISKYRNVIISEDIDMPRAITVAPDEGYMFWSDWGKDYPKIERVSMDGDNASRKILVDSNIAWPNGLTLDYENKWLYWIDAKLKYIGRVDWEGLRPEILFSDPSGNTLMLPVAISVYKSELYWTDYRVPK